jgi:TATA-binding protein-associated factor
VVNQQNAGLATMETDQILDLFNTGDTQAVAKQSEEDMVDVTTGQVKQKGTKGILDDIGELWDESQYTDEYNLDNFITSLKD